MKKAIIISSLLIIGSHVQAQSIDRLLNSFGNNKRTSTTQNTQQGGGLLGQGLSNMDISNGLKEALSLGANSASKTLSAKDGFFRNAAVKILMPKELQQVEFTLRKFGMGKLADQLILTMNRAAEDAAKEAAPIFLSAIKNMTLNDAISILNGGNGSATNYLRKSTNHQLMAAFSPVIQKSLSKVGADKAWNQVFSAYNKIGIFQKVNTDLTQYVTERATEGMYVMISEEENKIRKNPISYGSVLINKVFSK